VQVYGRKGKKEVVVSTTLLTWSIGPALSLPVLDGGKRAANEEVARVAYAAAEIRYRETARRAVQEVEEALLRGRAAAERQPSIDTTRRAQQGVLDAVAARHAAGLASALERDEAERALIAADGAQLALHREQLAAWLQLYRALGGGWQPPSTGQAAPAASKG
jgi:outer membrane protein TolC